MDNKLLTIAIPTYNRKVELLKTIDDLIKYGFCDHKEIRVCIIDNHSNYNLQEILEERDLEDSIYLKTNAYNFGLGANIMECFRICSTQWLWVLGDDDKVLSTSLQRILSCIRKAKPGTICINFSSAHGENKENKYIDNLKNLSQELKFSNMLFLSTNIFNATSLKPHYESGYRSCFFNMPHTSMVLNSLIESKNNMIWLRSKSVVNANHDYDKLTWSRSEMRKIRKLYPLIFSSSGKANQKLLKKYTTKGYGMYSRIINFLSAIKKMVF